MTKSEEERLAVIETKIDNIVEDLAEVKETLKGVSNLCPRVDNIEKAADKNEKEHDNFLSKKGFITASIILGVLLTVFTILQWINL